MRAVEPVADVAGFRDGIAPFINRHCTDCHGVNTQEADLALHAINGDILHGADIETWKTIAQRLALKEMPPEDAPQPDAAEQAKVLAWIKAELLKAGEDVSDIGQKLMLPGHGNRVDHATLFSADPQAPTASPARLWRISPQIYVSFLPRVASGAHLGQAFSSSSGAGFKDYADLFVVDEPTIGQLMRNAQAIVDGQCGITKLARPLPEFTTLLDPAKEPNDEEIHAAIRRQFTLSLLRAPTDDEIARFTTLMRKNIADAGREAGVKNTLAAVLLLPEAMYRFELGKGELDEHARYLLAPRELAAAIGLAFSDYGPDAALLKAAESGKLTTRADVQREIDRLYDDEKFAKPRIMRFFHEYFEYPAAEDVFKDLPRGKWRPELLINDTDLLIQHILADDRDVLRQLLTTNKSFVNAKRDSKTGALLQAMTLKKKEPKVDKKTGKVEPVPPRDPNREIAVHDYYNLPLDWQWTDRQPLELPAEHFAGILTQPSWNAAFASNNETHPIQRGKWIRERLLGGVVPDIPIGVDAKLPDAPDQTVRQRMTITHEKYCWQCHQKMNPLGLPLESYDFLGRFRSTESVADLSQPSIPARKTEPERFVTREVPLDSSGRIDQSGDPKLDGQYDNAVAMLDKLADSRHVRQVFVRHAFRYWMGCNETLADGPTLVRADNAYVESGGSMRALIASLLTSDSFIYRRP